MKINKKLNNNYGNMDIGFRPTKNSLLLYKCISWAIYLSIYVRIFSITNMEN